MANPTYIIIFYQEDSGREPVKRWLKKLDENEKIIIGEDLQTLQFRWALGMPLVKFLGKGLWELRTNLSTRICRIIFVVENKNIILLHGFIKKTQKKPQNEIETSLKRKKKIGTYGYS